MFLLSILRGAACLLQLLIISNISHPTYAEIGSNQRVGAADRVVFTKSNIVPYGWRRFEPANLTAQSIKWFRTGRKFPEDFKFTLISTNATYMHFVPKPGQYVVRFGVHAIPDCIQCRSVRLTVNNGNSKLVTLEALRECGSKLFLDIPFTIGSNRVMELKIQGENGFLAPSLYGFELFTSDNAPPPYICNNSNEFPSKLQIPTAMKGSRKRINLWSSPSLLSAAQLATSFEDVNININAGVDADGAVAGTEPLTSIKGSLNLKKIQNLPSASFSSAVQGSEFTYSFDLPPGDYNILLGFLEPLEENCKPDTRVFNVLINGNIRLEAFDIYSTTGCKTGIEEQFLKQTVDVLDPEPLEITFKGVAGTAIVSHLRIIPSIDQCKPVTTTAVLTDDHLAHSVPGEYPPNGDASYVDRAGNGFVTVTIDGSGSHTHFAYGSNNGKVTSYTWTFSETGQVVSTKQKFTFNFPLGTTRLTLAVTDDACSRDEAETSITVTGSMQSGAYCYYYKGLGSVPGPDTLNEFPRPEYAAVASELNLGFPAFDFRDKGFIARCTFFIEFTDLSEITDLKIDTANSGIARLYKGIDLVLDTNTSKNATTSTSIGLQQFELIYHYSEIDNTNPRLAFTVNDTAVPAGRLTHDQRTVQPILLSIEPNSGRVTGGERIKLTGYGLFLPLTVSFGGKNVTAQSQGATSQTIFVIAPAGVSGEVDVTVSNMVELSSNPLQYSYSSTCDPVAFTETKITMPDGSAVDVGLPTSVTTWSDGKLYIGTRNSVVRAVAYNADTLVVSDVCHSGVLTDNRYFNTKGEPSQRSVLGITFNPQDTTPRPYVSLSTLFWQRQGQIESTNRRAWSNGAVVRLQPASAATKSKDSSQCLQIDRMVIENLPVSDGDHAINELVFTQNGDLLVAVGGNTNAGLPYGPLGGNWESYFSGSVVIARLSRGSAYNGTIDYTTPDNLRTAEPQSDDVDIYATGVRNMFTMTIARSGQIYGADMGPNCNFGNASSSCDEYVEADAALRSDTTTTPFPGKAIVGPEGSCKYGDTRRDKLLRILPGKFYGHPNIQRAAIRNTPSECGYIDPRTGKTGKPAESPAPKNYVKQMSAVLSPLTTIREYGSNLFCGRLRHNLIMSRYKGRGTFRVRINEAGTALIGSPEKFNNNGGLRIEENVHGDLIFPRLDPKDAGIIVFRPVVADRTGLFVVNALPFMHPRSGGTVLRIGGWGFVDGATVSVGSNPCTVLTSTERELTCTMPGQSKGARSNNADVVVKADGMESLLLKAILYMT